MQSVFAPNSYLPERSLVSQSVSGNDTDWGLIGGFLWRLLANRAPDGGLTVSFQWDHIEYSKIVESAGLTDRAVDDADELHLGAEYVFLHSTPIVAVRLGAWRDPDHQLRATADEPLIRALLPRGQDQTHYAVGLGLAVKSFQIDVGVDFADRVKTVSVSGIYSF